jgi:hypothetical protein
MFSIKFRRSTVNPPKFMQNSPRFDVNVRTLNINVRLFPDILSDICLFSYTYWLRSLKAKIFFIGHSSVGEFYLPLLQVHTGRKQLSAGFFAFTISQRATYPALPHRPHTTCHPPIKQPAFSRANFGREFRALLSGAPIRHARFSQKWASTLAAIGRAARPQWPVDVMNICRWAPEFPPPRKTGTDVRVLGVRLWLFVRPWDFMFGC